jgi:hypothetical protein
VQTTSWWSQAQSANMQITEEFLLSEIGDLEAEVEKAHTFITKAQATVSAYNILLQRLRTPEEVEENANGNAN